MTENYRIDKAAKLFLEGQRLAWRAGRKQSLFKAGIKYGIGAFIKPLNSPTRYPEYHVFFEFIRSALGGLNPKESSILDVGSPKLFALLLAQKTKAQFTSIDIWDVPIEEAKALAGGLDHSVRSQLKLGVADIRKALNEDLLPRDKLFDIAFAMSVIEHIEPNPGGDVTALINMAALVKEGGKVLVSVPVDKIFREEFETNAVYGKRPGAQKKVFFQRVYDTKGISKLADSVSSQLAFEHAAVIEWPHGGVFSQFWEIRNTVIRGLLGPTFPLMASAFKIRYENEIPKITGPGDAVFVFKKTRSTRG